MRRLLLATFLVAAACGDNVTHGFEPWILDEVSSNDGFWVRTPEFEVASGEEIQDCYFFQVPDTGTGDLMIDHLQLALNPGSHHMNVFRVNTIVNLNPTAGEPIDLGGVEGTVIRAGECWKAPNWADWP